MTTNSTLSDVEHICNECQKIENSDYYLGFDGSLGYHHKKIDKVDNTGTTKISIGITALLNTTTLTLSRIAAVIYQTYR